MNPREALNKSSLSPVQAAQKAYELGYSYESKYGACSQCTILAIMDALGERNLDVCEIVLNQKNQDIDIFEIKNLKEELEVEVESR